jgi:hypothetical protein
MFQGWKSGGTPVNAPNLIIISPIISYYNASDKHYTC